MQKVEIEVLNDASDSPIVRFPGRKFPGVIIQGDSLWILYNSILELKNLCGENPTDDITDLFSEILDQVSTYLKFYERTLTSHDIELPYYGNLNNLSNNT